MKLLIDIGHPGHVHLFKNFAHEFIKKNHHILFTCREKEFEIELLKHEGFEFVSFGKKYQSTLGKIIGLLKFDFLMLKTALKFKPDLFLSHGSPYAAHAAFLTGRVNIALEDTGNNEQVRLYLPFTKHVLTSTSFHKNYGSKQVFYNAFHELAYLHPKRFNADDSVLNELGFNSNTKFFFLRFISWNASHDVGEGGLNLKEKIELVNYLNTFGKVIISSEKELPTELKPFQLKINPAKVHHVMHFATLFVGEGATMASECAMLGTPAIYINSMDSGTINEQEKAGLLYHFKTGSGVMNKVKELLDDNNLNGNTLVKRNHFLKNKIDLTSFLVWFLENYPASSDVLKNNPDYQLRFQ